MKLLFVKFFFVFISISANAQSTFKGRILDSKTGLPIISASIYINNSSKGSSSNADGYFEIDNLSILNFDIVASSIGYETFNATISKDNFSGLFIIKLKQKSTELQAVLIQSYEKDGWNKWGKYFKENLLGTIPQSEDCTIKNHEVIKFVYDKKNNILKGYADEPLIIINKYLGYEVKYDLQIFVLNFKTKILYFGGFPFFKELTGNTKKMKKWKANRLDSYKGSMLHFMRAIFQDKLGEEGFQINGMQKVLNLEKSRIRKFFTPVDFKVNGVSIESKDDSVKYYNSVLKQTDSLNYIFPGLIRADSISFAFDSNTAGISFKGYLQIKFTSQKKIYYKNEFGYYHAKEMPISFIKLINTDAIAVYADGSYYEPTNLLLEGYWSAYEKLCNLLPVNYEHFPD